MKRLFTLTPLGALLIGVELVAFAAVAAPAPTETADQAVASSPVRAAELDPAGETSSPAGRKLMIVGGGLTEALLGIIAERLISDVGGGERFHLLVVPGASGEPNWLHAWFEQVLPAHGVAKDNIELAHIAAADDASTPTEEAKWQTGAYQASEVAKLSRANVVWFSGGDQKRLVNLLVDESGKDSPFETALKEKFAAGQVIIAGHSAGAAAMSDPMIGRGTSLGALSLPPDPSCQSDDALCVQRGLGYVPSRYQVVVDQHFTQRGRLARLVRALALTDRKTGWGIGGQAAFYVDLPKQRAEVIGVAGSSFVTIIGRDGALQNHERIGPPFLGDNYTLSLLGVGDIYQLPGSAHPHGVGIHPVAGDYYPPFSRRRTMRTCTDAFGKDALVAEIAPYFADGTPQPSGARVDAIAADAHDSGAATAIRLRFTADADSAVAWNASSGFSIFNARLEISITSARFEGLAP